MLKHAQTIYAKYRGIAFSTVAYHPLSSTVMYAWKEHKFGVCGALAGGYVLHLGKCLYQRREHWFKVERMREGFLKRLKERRVINNKRYRAIMQLENDGKPSS